MICSVPSSTKTSKAVTWSRNEVLTEAQVKGVTEMHTNFVPLKLLLQKDKNPLEYFELSNAIGWATKFGRENRQAITIEIRMRLIPVHYNVVVLVGAFRMVDSATWESSVYLLHWGSVLTLCFGDPTEVRKIGGSHFPLVTIFRER